MTSGMTDTAAALDRLLAERNCVALAYRYAELADADEADSFAALFTPDGSWGRSEGAPIVGRAAIRATYAARARTPGSRHIVVSAVARFVDDQRAEVKSAAIVLKPAAGVVPAVLVGYVDDVHRGEDGVWRISRRTSEVLVRDWKPGA